MAHGSNHRRDRNIGRVFGGKYRIDAKLGEGGMGAVYRATQLAVDREVAIKVLRPHVAEQERGALVERFRREAKATSQLRHPNTVSVYDFGETEDGVLFMVLELLRGASLSQVIAQDAPMRPERVAFIGRQIAKSLAEAHANGIVHRDLKPDNIFICEFHDEPDVTKVMDFGIARLMGGESRDVTRTGMMIGTPKYIAPEQAMAKRVTPAADLYALGVILFEMLTGSPPFVGDSGMALALAHIHDAPPPLRVSGVPDALNEGWRGLVDALLAKHPKHRPQSTRDVANWLGQLEHDAVAWRHGGARPSSLSMSVDGMRAPGEPPSTYEGPSPKSTVTVSGSWLRMPRHNGWLFAAAAVFMVAGGVVSFFLVAGEEPPQAVAPVASDPAPATAAPGSPLPSSPYGDPLGTVRPGGPAAPLMTTRLVLTTTPPGAEVFTGTTRVCVTPCDVAVAGQAGGMPLRLVRAGYATQTISVGLSPGARVERTITLRRAPAAP